MLVNKILHVIYNKRIIILYNYIIHLYAYNKLYKKCIIIDKINDKLCEILNFVINIYLQLFSKHILFIIIIISYT